MSDMLENGASRGARPLPPHESHDEYLELCATATTGSLNAEERRRLHEHLALCESCREIMAQYQAIVDGVIPAWAPASDQEQRAQSGWSQQEAEARLFARLNESEGNKQQREFPEISLPPEAVAAQSDRSSSGDALWRHLWIQFAAASLLVAALGMIAYRTGMRRGFGLASLGSAPALSKPTPAEPAIAQGPTSDRAPEPAPGNEDPQLGSLRTQLEQSRAVIERLKSQQAQTEKNLSIGQADRAKLGEERAALSQQLEAAKGDVETLQEKLDSAASQSSQNSLRVAALQQKVDQLTESTRERDQEIARENELLDHDRDIRELMGSRDLYIAEVYDVAKTGDTQKPFGRVFYTSGKSLIFYAYDLDQQQGIERASTFQAWGRRGPDREHAANLGILYQDNANKKRWVLKSNDPKTLAQIDAVFVTVEPNGGSPHPSGKPLLFAYLRIQPNHP
jgi:hypothetical protein